MMRFMTMVESAERTGPPPPALMEAVASKQEAIEWSARFRRLHREHWHGWEGEIELRQLFDAPAGDPAV